MKKHYILDTSALIHDPCLYSTLTDCQVTIPIKVLEELDKLKTKGGEVAKNARVCIRLLDDISEQGDLSTGVQIENNVVLAVDVRDYTSLKSFGDPSYGDTHILACAYAYNTDLNDHNTEVILITNDINLRLKARASGITAESYNFNKSSLSELYQGFKILEDDVAGLDLQKYSTIDPKLYELNLSPNEFAVFTDSDKNVISMGRKVEKDKLKVIKRHTAWGINSRNVEQALALDLLMDRKIDLVTLIGRAGCGKTLLALAAGVELVINKNQYDKFIIYRPIQSVGKELGFLPGTLEEKLSPWFQAILDNMETLFTMKGGDNWKRELETYQRKGKIEMEAITYIRGRSIPKAIILIDEAQNLSNEEIKTILTRAGEGTKIILTGDIEQIDNSDLDAMNNGLTYAIEKFKHTEIAGHVTLTEGVRSRLATKASEIL